MPNDTVAPNVRQDMPGSPAFTRTEVLPPNPERNSTGFDSAGIRAGP